MTTNTYPFARFFIRIAIGLAVFVVILGFVFVVYFFSSMENQLDGARYQPSAAIGIDAAQLENSYIGTQNRLLHSLNVKAFPDNIQVINISDEIAKVKKLSPESQPSAYMKLGNDTALSINAIKKHHFDEFSIAINQLRQTLLGKAAELRRRYAQQQSTQPAPGSAPTPIPSTNPVVQLQLFRLFNDDLRFDESRLNTINGAKECMNDLRAKSQKQESLDQINQASIYLARAESLLDYMKKAEAITSNSSQQPLSQQAQEQEQMVSQAEQIAAQLDQYKSQLVDSLYSRWVVDADDQKLITDATEDLNRATAAVTLASGIRMNAMRNIGIALVACLAAAFLIIVVADFLRAFLNMSNNTDTLANAKLVGPHEEEKPPASD